MTLQQEALYAVRLLPEEKLPNLIAFARFLTQYDSFGDTAVPDVDTLTRKRRAVAGIANDRETKRLRYFAEKELGRELSTRSVEEIDQSIREMRDSERF